jgi:hypothetical protein
MKTYYTCGTTRDVRGNCGHRHRTILGAVRCNDRDQAGCASQGGYSDRSIVAVQDGRQRMLTESEYDTLHTSQ